MSTEKRNSLIRELTKKYLSAQEPGNENFPETILNDLNLVFGSEKRSFREIIFTINLARIVDPTFKSTIDLYGCNPRPVYEQGIKPVLDASGVPCTQSGPLNVTKATKAITDQWAAMKSPKNVGLATFRLAEYIDSLEKTELEIIAAKMGNLLQKDALLIDEMSVQNNPLSDSIILLDISKRLILEAVDGGNTAQRVVGILLQLHQEASNSELEVNGVDDSASTTNFTSKKVGDLSTSLETGKIISIYEVTLKKFNEQRISECSQSLIGNLGRESANSLEVIVLCRREDVPDSAKKLLQNHLFIGRFSDKFGIKYNFVDIFEWLSIRIIELDDELRARYFQRLENYINRVKTSVKVKRKWSEIVRELIEN